MIGLSSGSRVLDVQHLLGRRVLWSLKGVKLTFHGIQREHELYLYSLLMERWVWSAGPHTPHGTRFDPGLLAHGEEEAFLV